MKSSLSLKLALFTSFILTLSACNLIIKPSTDSMTKPPPPQSNSDATMDKSNQTDTTSPNTDIQPLARYLPYSPSVFSDSAGTRRILFFYANWCPSCISADTNLSQNQDQIPSDVTVIRVNYKDSDTDSAETQLSQTYGVTYQHTFVQIDENGNQVTKWNGGQIDDLLNRII